MPLSKKSLITVVFCCLGLSVLSAGEQRTPLSKLVSSSDVIAVIKVTRSQDIGPLPIGAWEFSQINAFRFADILKNSSGRSLQQKRSWTLWGKRSYNYARAIFAPGKYIVFLRPVGKSEWLPVIDGIIPIDNKGFVNASSLNNAARSDKKVSVKEALAQIRKLIRAR